MSDGDSSLEIELADGEDFSGIGGDTPSISIEEEMRRSYLDYAMSVVVSRAIPDLRDGLKPVHRRILYSMYRSGYSWNKAHRKSARVVGDVIGRYHPHGESSVYDALVRMAQNFSMSHPLIDGQGNFGSVDGDPPAAMRYTESRMSKISDHLMRDITHDTVDFVPNYDDRETEPSVLPACFPNILVNGGSGIAVGMATNIPPHNLGEVISGALAIINDPDISIRSLMQYIPAPDFPTGALIIGRAGASAAYHDSKGQIIVRSCVHREEIRKDREVIVIDEIPYQVNKASMIEKIAHLVKDKRIEGISNIQDESSREGIRVVIELKRDATYDVVLNQLYHNTPMQTAFSCNMLALVNGQPRSLTLKEILQEFIYFREEVVVRRTTFSLGKARDRAHILCGLSTVVENDEEIISIIRGSANPQDAKHALLAKSWPGKNVAHFIKLIDDPRYVLSDDGLYRLSEAQVKAILELRLQKLTALGRDEIGEELKKLADDIADYLDILRSRERIVQIVADELEDVRKDFTIPRRSEIIEDPGEVNEEDFIEKEDMIVTITHSGYVKRSPVAEYRSQKRGGKGVMAVVKKDEDFVTQMFCVNTHTPLLVFSTDGLVYRIAVWKFPVGSRQIRGKALINLLPINKGEGIAAVLPVDVSLDDCVNLQIFFAMSDGSVRRNSLADFINVKANGKIAVRCSEGVRLVHVSICDDSKDCVMTTKRGKIIRFPVSDVRIFQGRSATGVRGIRLSDGDEVVSMTMTTGILYSPEERRAYLKQKRLLRLSDTGVADISDNDDELDEEEGLALTVQLPQEKYEEMKFKEEHLLLVTNTGYGKRMSAYELRTMRRGGMGVMAMPLTRSGTWIVSAIQLSNDSGHDVVLVTKSGQSIRCPLAQIPTNSRAAFGVKVFRMPKSENVTSVTLLCDHYSDKADSADRDAEVKPDSEN